MGMKSPEEYREDARLVRALAVRADKENARHSLLGLADLLECFARRAESHAAPPAAQPAWARASTSDAAKQKELAREKAENAATVGQGIPGLDPSQLDEPDQIDPSHSGNSSLSRALFGP
jgi:hypothetical protein